MSKTGLIRYAPMMRLMTMAIVWLVLLVWHFNAYRADCAVSLGVLAVLSLFVAGAGVERAALLRRALLDDRTNDQAERLRVLLDSRTVMVLREGGVALVLAVILLVVSLSFEPRQWSVLFIDLLLLALLIPRMSEALDDRVPARFRYAIARRRAMWLSVLLLWGEALMVLMFSPPEDYFGLRWQEVVSYGVVRPDASCAMLGQAAEVLSTGRALAIWAVQNGARVLNDPSQAIMVWIGYGSLFAVSLLVALAYSRALVGVMARPWELRAARRSQQRGGGPAAGSGPEMVPGHAPGTN
jgi:uncharacterized protein YhhL (DUF1145 family)